MKQITLQDSITSYLHYQDTKDVLDEILDGLLPQTRELTAQISPPSGDGACCLALYMTD